MSVSFCLPHPVAVSAFMICRGLCACTEMLWMCVLYVSFGSKVRPRTFGCVAMGSALLFIVRSRLLVYSAGSGVNRVVLDSQREGLLVEMVNTGHIVGPGRRPQSRILWCLYLLKARVTCVGAPDWCCIVCDRFPQCIVCHQ